MKSALSAADFYKCLHPKMVADGVTKVYNNTTARNSRVENVDEVVVFGLQYFIKHYLIDYWNKYFFDLDENDAVNRFSRILKHCLGVEEIDYPIDNLRQLHKLGYLPIHIKALPEGSKCPTKVPFTTMVSTHKDFPWLPGYLETIEQNVVWGPMTSATTANHIRQMLNEFAEATGDPNFVPWQGHDFSMRGLFGMEAAGASGAAHLLSFYGTDTIPGIEFLEEFYSADIEKELVGGSVPATEHSIMQIGMASFNNLTSEEERYDAELKWFKELFKRFPKGILSVVSDTYDYWRVLTKLLPALKDEILARDGKLVIRPDSGDPRHIVAGYRITRVHHNSNYQFGKMNEMTYSEQIECAQTDDGRFLTANGEITREEAIGSVAVLDEIFGSTVNSKGYKELNPKIGLIYGDSINYDKAKNIITRLVEQKFASTNVVFGFGSFTYQYVTRDTFGIACKATSCVINDQVISIFKDPKTNKNKRADGHSGFKKSAKGLLCVRKDTNGKYYLVEDVTQEEEALGNELQTVFRNGEIQNETTLAEIRERIGCW